MSNSSGFKLSLGKQISIGAVLGILAGILLPHIPDNAYVNWPGLKATFHLVQDIFLNLIRMMIAPLIFASLVQGIAGTDDAKKVGRIGAKAILYFEAVTTIALVVGLLVVNLLQPGNGVILKPDPTAAAKLPTTQPLTFVETIEHIFPTSVIDSMAKGDVLQIVCFSVIFAFAVNATGEAGKPVLLWCDSLRQVMFSFAGIIMKVAPFGVGASLAYSVGNGGTGLLLILAKLVLTLYVALAVFVVVVLGSIILILRIPLRPFIRAMSEPFLLAFATANSEAALPMAFERMERFGVPRGIVGFILPLGYSFNLDGTTLYLAVASIFITQVAGTPFTLGNQIIMMLFLMVSSKGVAAVPRASFVVLAAAVSSFKLSADACAIILGVDAFMDMARTSVNVLGNCLASVVIAKWEGEFDPKVAELAFSGIPKKPENAPVETTPTP